MSEWLGLTLSKVTIESLLGRGGMAEVYVGLHTTLQRRVAVKILHGHLSRDSSLFERFRAEAQSVAALRHPNIVQVYDFDVLNDRPYIVMELLEGMSLAEYMRALHQQGVTLPIETVSQVIQQLAAALDYAHNQGIVHRDVKPANVMLRQGRIPIRQGFPIPPDTTPVLTDFGLARLTQATAHTAAGTVLGTPAYMSPEQVRGEAVDSRTDIYSLGVILYEMLAGRQPFDSQSDTPASLLYKQVHVAPPPLANVPRAISAVVQRSLRKDREERYQRVGELARDLQSAIGAPQSQELATAIAARPDAPPAPTVDQGPPSTTVPSARGGLRNLATVAAFALGAIVLAVGVLLGRSLVDSMIGGPAPSSAPAVSTTEAAAQPASPTPKPQTPTGASLSPSPTTLPGAVRVGTALLGDRSVALAFDLSQPPSSGTDLFAWLTDSTGTNQALLLGPVPDVEGGPPTEYDQTDGTLLLTQYDTILISLEPGGSAPGLAPGEALYLGSLSPETYALLRTLTTVRRQGPMTSRLLEGLQAQTVQFDSHLGLMVISLQGGDLTGGKLHAEHVINITEGAASPEYGDWDGDSRAQNPGDDFGLLPYLSLTRDFIESLGQATGFSITAAEGIRPTLDQLDQLIAWAQDARDVAERVAEADTLEEVQELNLLITVEDLRLKPGVDAFIAQVNTFGLMFAIPLVSPGP